jgi:hypothetical protein
MSVISCAQCDWVFAIVTDCPEGRFVPLSSNKDSNQHIQFKVLSILMSCPGNPDEMKVSNTVNRLETNNGHVRF